MGDGASNILVISDLHLGEDIKPVAGAETLHLEQVEQALAGFLDHYAEHRRDGRPWRLIVNGDMVDFLSVCLMPEDAQVVTGLHEDDHTWGLGGRPAAARLKMSRVFERHPVVFGALARFVGAGNALSIVIGNHDAEFHWPEVQQVFRERLRAAWDGRGAREAATFDDAVSFHPWFFFEDGVVWVEHGHQYDGYCSFDTILDPIDPTEEEFELNVGSAAMRYIGNHYAASAAAQADLGFVQYLATLVGRGWWGTLGVIGAYASMVRRLLTQWGARILRRDAFDARRRRHRERLAALARRARLPEDKLLALHRLRKPPAFVDLFRLMRAVMLDRLLVTLLALAVVPLLVATLPWSWSPAGVLLIFALVGIAHHLLASTREKVDPSETMRRMSARIRKLVRAPIVVFGHSHLPVAVRSRDGWYFNTGSWIGGGPEVKAFTHLIVERGEGDVRAALCHWEGGRSVVLPPARD